MTSVIELLLAAAAVVLLVPTGVLFLEVVLCIILPRRGSSSAQRRPSVAIVMPAHNEASIISATLQQVVPQLEKSDRLLVVADNCTDDTAAIAAAHGAEVLVRVNADKRGKGYALDFGVRHLEGQPPEVVIIVDADCQLSAGCIDTLARACAGSGRPNQALYLMHAPAPAALKMRIAEFAWLVKNQVRPTGLLNVGLPCQLMGTGMAFPWPCIERAQLASGHIVEDLKLGIDLARAGLPPVLCPEARVTSQFPTAAEGVANQRTRWEHGHLGAILSEAPRMLAIGCATLNIRLLALALDLMVPPLALLMMLTAGLWCACLGFFLLTHSAAPFALATAAAAMGGAAVALSWLGYGRRIISLGGLALALTYALWKIPLYVRFLFARQMAWVRSKRDSE